MLSSDDDILHALRRNGVGARVMVVLLREGPCTFGRLSAVTGSTRHRVRVAIRGGYPEVVPQHSLSGLGAVKQWSEGGSVMTTLTPAGIRWARRVEAGLLSGTAVGREYRRHVVEQPT